MKISGKEALALIKNNKKVAIVGLSPKEDRPSYHVGEFLIHHGFQVTPVNPGQSEILGQKAIASLAELEPGQVDWVDLFVNPTRLMDQLPEVLRLKPKLVWSQLGVVNDEFNQALEEAEITWIEIEKDEPGFLEFIDEVLDVLELPEAPGHSPNCQWCGYISKCWNRRFSKLYNWRSNCVDWTIRCDFSYSII